MVGSGVNDPRNQRILALWMFKDEIKEATSDVWKVPQGTKVGIGTPVHKHEGFLEVADGVLTLFEGGNRKDIAISQIRDPRVGFDENFRRSEDSRGFLPPLHFSFGEEEVYIYTLGARFERWRGSNSALMDAIAGN